MLLTTGSSIACKIKADTPGSANGDLVVSELSNFSSITGRTSRQEKQLGGKGIQGNIDERSDSRGKMRGMSPPGAPNLADWPALFLPTPGWPAAPPAMMPGQIPDPSVTAGSLPGLGPLTGLPSSALTAEELKYADIRNLGAMIAPLHFLEVKLGKRPQPVKSEAPTDVHHPGHENNKPFLGHICMSSSSLSDCSAMGAKRQMELRDCTDGEGYQPCTANRPPNAS
ncbi:hypothetical protein P7K49_018339 [Saguinus oedipus]|uniref:Jun dimerization protein 2 n=1 Tax=Saguinus oedipus TaxID=9490 RepID=A0ABQ9V744_SAGOE|nr:hypothetical protein P7K49_018339 [Saguinus oedipus]